MSDLIRIPFLTAIDPRALPCASHPRRKIYLQEKSMRVHFSNSTRASRYGPGISFPGRGCLTFLVTFVLNRRRDPDILSASSLTCRYHYIGSTSATIDEETKSILYPARANRVYILTRRQWFFSFETRSLSGGMKRTKLYVRCSVSLGEKKLFSVITEKSLSFPSTLLCKGKWIKVSWQIFAVYTA